jgi:hypothetical protein
MKFEGLVCENGKVAINTKCSSCGHSGIEPIPNDVVKLMKECGCNDYQIAMNYREHSMKNSWFSCFSSLKCSICGEQRVLCWLDGCSPSGVNVISPSECISFWPSYDYPINEVNICKWCQPDNNDKKSRDEFLMKLFVAMQKEEDNNWKWKTDNKK